MTIFNVAGSLVIVAGLLWISVFLLTGAEPDWIAVVGGSVMVILGLIQFAIGRRR